MRLLVTRPLDDGLELAARLEELGHEAIVEPLLSIAPDLAAALPLAGASALLFTSANGVRAFALRSQERGLPVFAVGAATARAAREVGFAQVASAEGDAPALEALVAARRRPADGPLLHVAGRVVAGDLAGRLAARGFEVRTASLYVAEPALRLSDAARSALAQGGVDGVLVFSPRSAAILVGLMEAAGLREAAARVDLFALSGAVAAAASRLAWRRVVVAASPAEGALLDALASAGTMPPGAAPRAEDGMQAAQRPQDRPGPAAAPAAASVAPRAGRARLMLAAGLALAGLVALAVLGLGVRGALDAPRRDTQREAQAMATEQRLARAEAELAALRSMPGELAALARGAERIEASLARIAEAGSAQAARLVALEAGLRQEIEAARAAAAAEGAGRERGAELAALAALASENQRLAAGLAALREELARMADAREAARVAEERHSEERRMAAERDARVAAAVAALRVALARGADPAAELAALRVLATGQPRLSAALPGVEALAARAPATPDELRTRFPGLAAAALRAARAPASSSAWWDAALARLSALVQLRRVGEVEGEDAEALLARAERRLAAGELAAAAELVARIEGPAAPVLAAWLEQARARAALDAALAALARAAAAPG